jgi:hypothetical protein
MKEYFENTINCRVLHKEVNVKGCWSIHESSTGPKPKVDSQILIEFDCDDVPTCGYDKGKCPERKAMQAERQ